MTHDMINEHGLPVIPASFCRLVRLDANRCSPRFIYYALQDLYNRGGTWEYQNQSTGISNLNFSLLAGRFQVPIHEARTQHAIAEVLGALDDKIAGNSLLIQDIDRLAATIFETLPLSDEPKPLPSLAKFVNGRAFTKGASGCGRVVIRIAELNSGIGASTVRSDIEVADDHLARPGDLLFAWSGSLTVTRWIHDEAIVNQHIFKVVPGDGVPGWLMHQLLSRELPRFKSIAQDKATTMGHIQRHHLEVPVTVPSREAVLEHDQVMTALASQALAIERESLHLASLRDTLLPHLMSGRLRVKDAERQVEDVL